MAFRDDAIDVFHIEQGVLPGDGKTFTRIRIKTRDYGGHFVSESYVTIKGPQVGLSRPEYEYKIPIRDAEEILSTLCVDVVKKTRYVVPTKTHIQNKEDLEKEGLEFDRSFEIDVFEGENKGLVILEIELESEEEEFEHDYLARKEVSCDPRYSNSNLGKNPWKNWNEEDLKLFDGDVRCAFYVYKKN